MELGNFEHVSDVDGEDKIAFEALHNLKQTRRLLSQVLDEMSSPQKKARISNDADSSALKQELAALKKSHASLKKSVGKG